MSTKLTIREALALVRDCSSQEWQQADGKRMAATDNQGRRMWFITEDVMQAVRTALAPTPKVASLRFNADQKAALLRLEKGEEVLWMQSSSAFGSLQRRGFVRAGFDNKGRVIANLTDDGRAAIKDTLVVAP